MGCSLCLAHNVRGAGKSGAAGPSSTSQTKKAILDSDLLSPLRAHSPALHTLSCSHGQACQIQSYQINGFWHCSYKRGFGGHRKLHKKTKNKTTQGQKHTFSPSQQELGGIFVPTVSWGAGDKRRCLSTGRRARGLTRPEQEG